jgi:hypothetical protein
MTQRPFGVRAVAMRQLSRDGTELRLNSRERVCMGGQRIDRHGKHEDEKAFMGYSSVIFKIDSLSYCAASVLSRRASAAQSL